MMKKILVAEDSSVIVNLTKKILTVQNFEIISVKNGEQVLNKLSDESFDLILMDINMPKMDGLECTRAIRKMTDPKNSQIPIIAITGNAMNLSDEEFKEIGINEFLPKPLDFDRLVKLVKQYTE